MEDLLLQETLSNYNNVVSNYKSSGYSKFYELNAFWSDANMKDMLKILNNSNTAMEVIHSAQRTFMFSVNTSDPIKEKAVDWLLAEQKRRGIDIFDMDSSVEESVYSNPENNALRQKRILTPDFLRTVSIVHEIKKYCKIIKTRFYIIELGGGCGHLARTLKLFIPNCSYVIIDIPETLSFSYMFLKLNFPNLKMVYITDEHQLKECSTQDIDYIFIPTRFAEGILENDFDLFINTASLGEMKNSVIRYWMDFIQNKLKVKYLFTLNRYLNTIRTDGSMDWRLDENECSVLYGADWEILNWELEPSFVRCPYVDTIIARYLEIVAERRQPISVSGKKRKSQELLLQIMDEDWVRLEKFIPSEMTYRDNILVNNMTMDGTLFKLWESIRLYPNEVNVGLMLKYLETLIHRQGREFEETYYYENLFETLFRNKENKDLLKIYTVIKQKCEYRESFRELPASFSHQFVSHTTSLVKEGYNGFNIVLYGGKYYAVAQSLGPVDLQRVEEKEIKEYQDCGKCVIGNSLYETKHLVDQIVCKALEKEVEALHKTFAGREGEAMDLQSMIAERDTRNACLQSDISTKDESIGSLRKTIDLLQNDIAVRNEQIASLQSEISTKDESIKVLNREIALIGKPRLIGTHRDYNIVKYANKYYGVLRALGPIDFDKDEEIKHPSIISAKTQIGLERLIDEAEPSVYIPQLLEEFCGYNLVAYGGCIYGIPQVLGKVDLNRASEHNSPLILSAEDKQILKEKIDILNKSISVEYAGWLPCFQQFGNCGNHPQFAHINTPPLGYRFTFNASHSKTKLLLDFGSLFKIPRLVLSILGLSIKSLFKGAKISAIVKFIKTRDFLSQMMLPKKLKLLFLPSVPYTYNQHDWVIEIEDTISMFFPFVHNGQTALVNCHESPCFPIVKTLVESQQCRGIITHIKSTAESLPKLFKNERLSEKIKYVPLGVRLPPVFHGIKKERKETTLLFNNSWHQDPRSFFLRGGLDVLSAFGQLKERYRYEELSLVFRSSLPSLDQRYIDIIERNNVQIIGQFLSHSDWELLIMNSDIYLLPSDRIHVVSMLEAMSYGLAVVVSDGWGVEEYVQDRVNGMIVRGRYGRAVWMDDKTGMLCEDYKVMSYEDPVVVKGLVEAISNLIEDKDLYERISRKARYDIETKYNLENWNKGLKEAFDKALKRD